jgi:glycosyltransferase involved in cell wall biosynthesis
VGDSINKKSKGIREKIVNFFYVPDRYSGWLVPGILKGLYILLTREIDVIYSSSPPPTALWIGYYLKKITGKSFVVDFRDPWTMQYPKEMFGERKIKISLKLEAKIVKKADKIIVNTEQSKEKFCEKYGSEIEKKIITITNGYDPADFITVSDKKFKTEGKFLISHTGEFFENGQRVPDTFLKAVSELIHKGKISEDSIEIAFVGGGEYVEMQKYKTMIKDLKLTNIVKTYPHLPHSESIACLEDSDALLLLQNGKFFNNQIPAKTFEYLHASKPILVITFPGAISNMLKNIDWCKIVSPEKNEDLQVAIYEIYKNYRESTSKHNIDLGKVEKFSRISLTEKLAETFNHVAEYE